MQIQSVWTDPSPPIEGQSAEIFVEIINQGLGTIPGFLVAIDDDLDSSNGVLEYTNAGSLAQSETVTISFYRTMEKGQTLYLNVDYDNQVSETNEINNTGSVSLSN